MADAPAHRYGRAVLAALLGAVPAAVLVGWLGGTAAAAGGVGGWGALGAALAAGAVGACMGAGLAQLVAFRHERAGRRRTAAAATGAVALVAFGVLWPVLEPLELDVVSPQLTLATSVVAAALIGRAAAIRRG